MLMFLFIEFDAHETNVTEMRLKSQSYQLSISNLKLIHCFHFIDTGVTMRKHNLWGIIIGD